MVRSRTVHRKSIKRTEPRRQERVGVKFHGRHPVDCPREGDGQKKRIKMGDVIGHHHRGIGTFPRAGSAPDVHADKWPE